MPDQTNDSKKKLQILLMYHEAKSRNDDADVLETSISTKSDSGYLLRLLAFEVSLKCVLVIHDINPSNSHNYFNQIKKLPSQIYDRIIDLAENRMAGHTDFSNHQVLLKTFSKNFIALRYTYEKYKNIDENEYLRRGNEWYEAGCPVDKAEFIYYASELFCLIDAMLKEIKKWLDENPWSA